MEVINNFLETSFSFSKHKVQSKSLPNPFFGILILLGLSFIGCYKLKNKFSIFPNFRSSLHLITNLWKTNITYRSPSISNGELIENQILDIQLIKKISEHVYKSKIISQPSINIDRNVVIAWKERKYHDALITIIKYCFKITEVSNLYMVEFGVSDQTISFLIRYNQLTRLCFFEYQNITDVAITQIALRCPGLTSIELIKCPKITDKGINSISMYCLKLTSVVFTDLNITDRPIIKI